MKRLRCISRQRAAMRELFRSQLFGAEAIDGQLLAHIITPLLTTAICERRRHALRQVPGEHATLTPFPPGLMIFSASGMSAMGAAMRRRERRHFLEEARTSAAIL